MTAFIHELLSHSAQVSPQAIALHIKDKQITYAQLQQTVVETCIFFQSLGVTPRDRVGIYLAKNIENVASMFACSNLSAVFVPINPVLKAPQVSYIANNCQIKLLITNRARLTALTPLLSDFKALETIVIIDDEAPATSDVLSNKVQIINWSAKVGALTKSSSSNTILTEPPQHEVTNNQSESDLAAILYTSGSTGQPKGIMLSHTNIVLGAKSVNQYLALTAKDTILAVLPLSFDYGLNQLMSSFLAGASCVLFDYLLANDVIKAIKHYNITGIAAVPPLWLQLTKAKWPKGCADSVRFYTNSGGSLSLPTLEALQMTMPQAQPYLMYGLTEAFRSTYLDPKDLASRPNSIGKAIPNSEILVLREDGTNCDVNEVGELVHIGPLVTLGYWQNKPATAARYKATPKQAINKNNTPLAVFSGDYVKQDEQGFIYFVSRKDNMIKTSGYRVSPNELESVLITLPQIEEVAIIASPSITLGQSITALIICPAVNNNAATESEIKQHIIKHCQRCLPNYMVPKDIYFLSELPRNANGKVDTHKLSIRFNKNNEQSNEAK